MQRLVFLSLFWISLTEPCLAGSEVKPEFIKRNFKFELLTSDPLKFTQSYGQIAETKGPIAQKLDHLLQSSRSNIDAAIYGVHKQSWFFETLTQVKQRIKNGIHAVVDQRSGDYGQWKPENFMYPDTHRLPKLLGEKSVLPDLGRNNQVRASTIMHNKFFVVDGTKLWIGSANISNTGIGAGYNANSVLIIDEPNLASHFASEFKQMFGGRQFSRLKPPHTNRHFQYMDGTKASVYFSPQDPVVSEGIIPKIEAAKSHIDIAMFYLTEVKIVNALIVAQEKGVKVRLILDALAARHQSSPVETLRLAGVEVRVENWGGKMHMKSAIIDSETVITGSMNWSKAGAMRNDESTLIVENQELASELTQYFEKLWGSLNHYQNVSSPEKSDRSAESLGSKNSCFDGIDNDYDGKTDMKDPACQREYLNSPIIKLFGRVF